VTADDAKSSFPERLARPFTIFLILAFLSTLAAGLIFFFKDQPLSSLANPSPAPYLRIYVKPNTTIPPVTVDLEEGATASGTYLLISFNTNSQQAQGAATSKKHTPIKQPVHFDWTIALLCVPAGTTGEANPDASKRPSSPLAVPDCGPGLADSGRMVTGTYNSAVQDTLGSAPLSTSIAADRSYLTRFIVPNSDTLVSSSGDDIYGVFPHILSSNACHLPPQGTGAAPNPSGPSITTGESNASACARLDNFSVKKTLDVQDEKVELTDTNQVPSAAGFSQGSRPGFVWDDATGDTVTFVQANSQIVDVRYHNDEVFAGLILAASGGVFIALVQELLPDKKS
jgi:hypothetical protein